MKKMVLFASSLLLLLSFHFLISATPTGIRYKDEIFPEVDITKDIVYGQNYNSTGELVELKMDVYEPHGDTEEKRALVIFIHGGGFVSGDKASRQWVRICTTFAKRGYVSASINYRLQPKGYINYGVAITQAMHDAKAAVRYFRANSDLWHIDDEKIAMGGGSAGAVTALYTTYLTEPQYEGNSGSPGYSSRTSACVDMWGGLYGNVTEIDPEEPPVLIIHGTEDETVPFSEAINISNRCGEVGVYCEMYPLVGKGHAPWDMENVFLPWMVKFLYGWVEDLWVNIVRPSNYLYVFDREIMPTSNVVIVGKITVKTDIHSDYEIDGVKFYVDNKLKYTDEEPPFQWVWNDFIVGRHEVKVIARDKEENEATDKVNITIFNI